MVLTVTAGSCKKSDTKGKDSLAEITNKTTLRKKEQGSTQGSYGAGRHRWY